jgi:mono/diheme cytochrome c family protein
VAAKRLLPVFAVLLTLVGCVRGCPSRRPPIHINPNMFDQPKYRPQDDSRFFYDGATMRPEVPGTVPRSTEPLERRSSPEWNAGKDAAGVFVSSLPLAVDDAVLARGRERYGIYCAPCHDARGTGRGILFERGKIPTRNLLEERVTGSADGQIFDVISNGVGLMPSYRYPIPVADRWAIVAWVRELQRRGGVVEEAP